jgi:hypothetical protein
MVGYSAPAAPGSLVGHRGIAPGRRSDWPRWAEPRDPVAAEARSGADGRLELLNFREAEAGGL